MNYLTKEENKKAYETYLIGNRQTNVSLNADEMIQKLKENFVYSDMTNEEKGKLKEITTLKNLYLHEKIFVLR